MIAQLRVSTAAPPTTRARARVALRRIAAGIIVVHGLIQLLGAAKGLGGAQVSQLTEPVGFGRVASAIIVVAVVLTGTAQKT